MSQLKHPGPDPGNRNLARKRVRIDAVVSLPAEKDAEEKPAGFPSLVSFANAMGPREMEDLSMRMVKRRRTKGENDVDRDGDPTELIAQHNGREWRAKKSFTEMNHDYFIGVRNKKTNAIQLFEVDGMYSLRPFVRRRRDFDVDHGKDEKAENRTYREQRKELLQTFGGKRSVRKVEKYEKDRITEDKLDEKAQIQVSEAAKRMKERDAKEGIQHLNTATTESMAPPHDNSATTVEDAYPLQGLITPGELAALEQEATSMIETCAEGTEFIENPGWNPLVWGTLVGICRDKEISDALRIRRMQAAMHLHYLIVLSNCASVIREREQYTLMEDMAVDKGVLRCLLERFSVPYSAEKGKHTLRRKTQADSVRLFVYSIVMWITATGFQNCGSLGDLAKALGITSSLLVKYAMQIGCKVRRKQHEKDPNEYRIALKVPLTFPPIRKRQGRPQKRS